MTDASTFSNLAQIDRVVPKALAHEFQRVHAATIRQNLARCKRQDLSADERQNLAMDYRCVLAENVKELLRAWGWTRETIPAYYLAGTKKGRRVSPRTIGYILDGTGPSPALDVIAAIAGAPQPTLQLMPWQLLVPGFKAANPPHLSLTDDERKLHEDFEKLRAALDAVQQR